MKIKADLHTHSAASDDGRHSVSELARAAASAGLDAIAVCDHNFCTETPAYESGILIIHGVELSTDAGHILGLFLERPVDILSLRGGNDATSRRLPTAEESVRRIRDCGGLAVLAHPFERRSADKKRLLELDVDLIETANSRASMKLRDANKRADELADKLHIGKTGGSDAHGKREVGACYTVIDVDEISLSSIKKALTSKRCEAVSVRECSWRSKAMSQWKKARGSGSAVKILKTLAYLAASPVRDIAKTIERKTTNVTHN